jgi:ribosomal protein L36
MVNGLLNFELYLRPCGAQNYCRLPIADCRLPIADCRLPIAPAFAKATAGKDCRLVRRSLAAVAKAMAAEERRRITDCPAFAKATAGKDCRLVRRSLAAVAKAMAAEERRRIADCRSYFQGEPL